MEQIEIRRDTYEYLVMYGRAMMINGATRKNDTKGERAMNSTVSIIIELQTFIFCCTNNYGASCEQGESGIVESG